MYARNLEACINIYFYVFFIIHKGETVVEEFFFFSEEMRTAEAVKRQDGKRSQFEEN